MTDAMNAAAGDEMSAGGAAASNVDAVDAVAAFEGRMAKVSGAVRSGKTESLVRRAVALLERGEDPADILVITTTAIGAAAFRTRLIKAAAKAETNCEAAAARVRVSTAQNACLDVLDGEGARAATGRVPRVIVNFEYNFFLEDMKTLGVPARRLRSLLKRLQKQWCALAPEREWLLPGEEQTTLDFAMGTLRSMNAMLPDEVAWLCATYLQSEAGRPDAQRFAYVLCDDFQNLSRAQQTSVCLLAREQIIVTGNAGETVTGATSFPCPQGFQDFDTLRRGVETFQLTCAYGNTAITAFADAIAEHDSEAQPASVERVGEDEPITFVKWNTPEDELNGLTKLLRAAASESKLPESSFALVAPNKRWARTMASMLRKRGFATSMAGFAGLGGDPRDLQRSRALQAYTMLNLLANPDDTVAWRCWCGFGNYLTNSDAWSELSTWAADQELSLTDALARASKLKADGADEPFLRAWALVDRWDEGQRAIEDNAPRRGFALLRAVGAASLPEFAQISDELEGTEDARKLFAMVRRAEVDPVFPEDPHVLHITSYNAVAGCDYAHVVACSCVDGFMPVRAAFEVVSTDEERDRILSEQRRSFASGVAKASGTLTLSTFSKADLEVAETAKMQVTRVRSENGKRMANLRPTCFIAEAGSHTPTTAGGQSLLAERNLD